ncbi:phosphotransferase [Massilia sp. METH4]|uniref:phosphotransferase n=1 Tax=Massilia sp. METH4 TaxID=3123041 RepID=UPI0030D5900F
MWLLLSVAVALLAGPATAAPHSGQPDHAEFSAWLEAPFRADGGPARRVALAFEYPGAPPGRRVDWRLELRAPGGRVIERWRGSAPLTSGTARHAVAWRPGRAAPGIYRLRMTAAVHGEPATATEEERQIAIGAAPSLPAPPTVLRGMARPEWDIYLGNLHSQTGHSDGGVPVAECTGASEPGTMAAGPREAYAFAHRHGLDFLLTSEHNHMYDGSEGNDTEADPEAARQLYRRGLAQAAAYTAEHPGFVALHGLEWGVITNGGHLNILDTPELLGWERNEVGEVIGDTFTGKHDYEALYSLLARRGWLGQFNHPNARQFRVRDKPLGHVPEADEAMALCEVTNSAAFSNRTDEGESRMSSFESTCQRALEAGWHVAFSSNQDNHCANWGAAAPNRTGVLLPRRTPFNAGTLLDAIRARRVFATTDKSATLVLTANGHVMGQRITDRGTLTLAVQYGGGAGRAAAQLLIVSGVPGREGEPETMTLAATRVTLAPSPGQHYYYARLTQDDGSLLWSAPIWVKQER